MILRHIVKFVLLFLLFPLNGKGEQWAVDTLEYAPIKFNGDYFKRFWTDTRGVVTAPFHWDDQQWLKAGAVVGTTGLLFLADDAIRDFSQDRRIDGLDKFSGQILEPWGTNNIVKNYSFYAMGAFMGYGLIANDPRSRNTAFLAFEAYALTFVYVQGIKRLAGRERPSSSLTTDPHEWKGPGNGKSFPSGHTASVFAMAAVVAEQYKEVKWIPWFSYSFASLVGLSRIYENKHWSSDVFFGACLGTAVGQFIARNQNSGSIACSPVISSEFQGLSMKIPLN